MRDARYELIGPVLAHALALDEARARHEGLPYVVVPYVVAPRDQGGFTVICTHLPFNVAYDLGPNARPRS